MAVSRYHRFAPNLGWLEHVWKSATRQDHVEWRSSLRALIPDDGVAIDVGAHGGQFTRLLADIVSRGTVVALEPSSYARSILRPALWLRRTRNAIVVPFALGARAGHVTLRTPVKVNGSVRYGLATVDGGSSATSVSEVVPMMTLDSLIGALALSRVDFIKADIEGHEGEMIAGARETLRRFRPVVLLEFNADYLARAGTSVDLLWAEMIELGYRPHSRSVDHAMPVAIGDAPRAGDILWVARASTG